MKALRPPSMFRSEAEYQLLPDGLNTPTGEKKDLEEQQRPGASLAIAFQRSYWPFIFHSILLACSGILFLGAWWKSTNPRYCLERLSTVSPGLEVSTDNLELVQFDLSSGASSKYGGPPSPERDAAWDRVTQMGAMSVGEDIFRQLNASVGSVRLPEESGGGYMVMLDFVHELHCIDRLWRNAYPEYYIEEYNETVTETESWHSHADHCAEYLRQVVMCNADVSLAAYNWIQHHRYPRPNWNLNRKCRNFDATLEWAFKNRAEAPADGRGVIRPEDGSMYHEYTSLPVDPHFQGIVKKGTPRP